MDFTPAEVSFASLVDYVEGLCRPLTADKGLGFTVRLDDRLPAVLHTDERRLQQILRNLLSNAVKFTESGEVRLTIGSAEPGRFAKPSPAPGRRGRRLRGHRHRHRHPGGQAEDHLRGVPAGGRDDQPAVRRDRAGAVDQPGDRAPARRRDPGGLQHRARVDVHALPADALGATRPASRRTGPLRCRRRRTWTGPRGTGRRRADRQADPGRRRRRPQRLRAGQRPGAERHGGLVRRHRRQRDGRPGRRPGRRRRADGRDDARHGRQRDDGGDPVPARARRAADHRGDGQGDAGRPGAQPERRRLRLRHQAGGHRITCSGCCANDSEGQGPHRERETKVLLVDDRPENLLALEAILAVLRPRPGPGQLRRRGAQGAADRRLRGDPAGRQHAGHGRPGDGRADQAPGADPGRPDHLPDRRPPRPGARVPRLLGGRRGLRLQAVRPVGAAGEGGGLRRPVREALPAAGAGRGCCAGAWTATGPTSRPSCPGGSPRSRTVSRSCGSAVPDGAADELADHLSRLRAAVDALDAG